MNMISNGDLMEQAIAALKAGDQQAGKDLLRKVLKENPKNAHAWYLMSFVVDEKERAVYCIKKCLEFSPGNHAAIKRLEKIKGDRTVKKGEYPIVKLILAVSIVMIGLFSVVIFFSLISGNNEQDSKQGLSYPEIIDNYMSMTSVQWIEYEKSIRDTPVEWSGTVYNVEPGLDGLYVSIDMDSPPDGTVEVGFYLPESIAKDLAYGEAVHFNGRVMSAKSSILADFRVNLYDVVIIE